MRLRAFLILSLCVNLFLGVSLYYSQSSLLETENTPVATHQVHTVLVPSGVKTNVVVRRRNFTWGDIESLDYHEYIANLRAIGCPELTIRDIIIADVNQLYSRKKATDIVSGDQQWWKSEPDANIIEAAAAKQQALEQERRALLTNLLGPSWDAENLPPMPQSSLALDGPVLGSLSSEAKQQLQQLEAAAAEKRRQYVDNQEKLGLKPDPAEVARLRQETRGELAKILTPEQLEEYLLRYSSIASSMRDELRGFSASPDEFRSIFRARDSIDQQLALLPATDPATLARKQQLEQMRDASIQQALGPERYPLFHLTEDPIFRQSQASAEQFGAPPEKVLPLFQVNQATAKEQERIRGDSSLSSAQQAAALQEVLDQQQDSLRKLLGEEAYNRYLESQGKKSAQ